MLNYGFLRFLSVGSILFIVGLLGGRSVSLQAQDHDENTVRSEALKFLMRIENVTTFSLHAETVDAAAQSAKVWLDVRGDSYWCERLITYEGDRKESGEQIEKLRRVVGGEARFIDAFDQLKTYSYLPLFMEARIDRKPKSELTPIKGLYPRNWTCFQNQHVMPFSSLLQREKDLSATWQENEKVMRFTHSPEVKSPKTMFKKRWIDVDPSKDYAVVGYELSGGAAGVWEGAFDWKAQNQSWYVAEGNIKANGKVLFHWKIDEFNTDAKKVRQTFAMDESKLPFATRITETATPNSREKSKIRFVGGDEGKKEHDLRAAARNNVRLKQ